MMWIAAAIVVTTLVAMASGKVHPVLALLTGLVTAGLLRITPAHELFGGFSNGSVITVGAMLVIAKGIVSTGVINRVTWLLLATTKSAQQTLRRLMAPIGIASALINTTPLVALTIPATRRGAYPLVLCCCRSRTSRLSPARSRSSAPARTW